jgi:hypothetical protein
METVVICIHGLRNKPPKYILANWWKKSLIEGFRVIDLPVPQFHLEMAYWAHYIYERPQNPDATTPGHPQYLPDPYVPGTCFGPRDPQAFKKQLTESIHQQLFKLVAGKSGFMNINAVSDIILHRMFQELDTYYHHRLRDAYRRLRPAKELFRNELANLIIKNRKKSICILAHSMGTIIAYDVLLHMVRDIPVHTLITFGSPLGFPVIIRKIRHELGRDENDERPLPTPECLQQHWLNFSDLEDQTCLNYNLRNNYTENSNRVRPFDEIVYNNYECYGVKNPHKAYGYLRTAEVTRAVYNFLTLENAGVWQRIKWVFSKPVI